MENFNSEQLIKLPTGIPGLDEITGGGLPKGRPAAERGAAKRCWEWNFSYTEPDSSMSRVCFSHSKKPLRNW